MKRNFKKLATILLVVFTFVAVMGSFSVVKAASAKPVLHLKFDGDFKDASGNAYDGTRLEGKIDFVNGISGKGAFFQDAYLELANSEKLNFSNNFTISTWAKVSAEAIEAQLSNMNFLSKLADGGSSLYFGLGYGLTSMGLELSHSGADGTGCYGSYYSNSVDPEMLAEKWSLMTITYDGNEVKHYIDGKYLGSVALTDDNKANYPTIKQSDKKVMVGLYPSYPALHGYLDDLRVYDSKLSGDEIRGLYEEFSKGGKTIILKINDKMMTIGDRQLEIDPGKDTTPVIDNGRTLVPIRAIVEQMGGSIAWNDSEKRVDITLKGKVLKLWIDKTTANVDGVDKILDVAPKIINERTMLPVRFVTENLGAQVDWNGDLKKITITYN